MFVYESFPYLWQLLAYALEWCWIGSCGAFPYRVNAWYKLCDFSVMCGLDGAAGWKLGIGGAILLKGGDAHA